MNKIILSLVGILVLASCSEPYQVDYDDPENVLLAYFHYLSNEDYEALVTVYGGSYELLQGYHADVDPNNYAELFRRYIHITGGQAVQIKDILDSKKITDHEYQYTLTFLHLDGTEFFGGKQYSYTVKRINGKFLVMEIPPYLA